MGSNRRQNRSIHIEPDVEATLRSWLSDLAWIDPSKVEMTKEDGTVHFRLETAAAVYGISANAGGPHERPGGYLGCIASVKARGVRGRPVTNGGNDLPDGPFDHDMWTIICKNILGYELELQRKAKEGK